jgi:hypothetical protein
MEETHFALLGVAWAKVEAMDGVWEIPDGSVTWIGWPVDEDAQFGGIHVPGPPGSTDLDRRTDAGRVHIRVQLSGADALARANDVADAVAGMMASPQSPVLIETSIVPISIADVRACRVDTDALRRIYFGDDPSAIEALQTVHRVGALPPILDRLNVVLSDGDLDATGVLPALVFWRLAVDEYAFAPHEVREALHSPSERMPTRIDQARAEQSVQNAFKALEALIGGWPPKDDAKFAERLIAIALEPLAIVGPPSTDQRMLLDRLIWLRELRSTQAAHGGKTSVSDRSLSWQQLITAHWTVWHCIYERIEALHASRPT